ncbi:threonine aldolase family protein [Wenxinia saemankumensis]|uniref:L-threonine aldolase n=1 Tax=Wenxinia saemankumensis TaxID=1447782 RepID=A0A1M6BVL9_9RHOB|nr:beta-eliminating lyase-related protein [Wenxinia saemankumensis]SHI52564.1 L-threonine aldolase [Wenxinia saemankumensis]
MFFASDNGGPAHPRVMEALIAANDGYTSGYGAEALAEEVRGELRRIFEAPEAAVYLVPTGTAANALILATLGNPWDAIFCTAMAHINEDECNAPEFYSGGAKLVTVPDERAKMRPEALRAAILEHERRGVHGAQRGPVSITQVTEKGTVHTLDEIAALTDTAKAFGLPVHLDGARFANAQVALGCSAAEMTWKAGIDAVSFGGTKNGCLGVEACIFFDPAHGAEFELRRKRGAHLFSKHRLLSAQMQGYLAGDLWLELAAAANSACALLTAGLAEVPEVDMPWGAEANMIFFTAPRSLHRRLQEGGARYYVMDGDPAAGAADERLTGRLVCDWSIGAAGVDRFLALL